MPQYKSNKYRFWILKVQGIYRANREADSRGCVGEVTDCEGNLGPHWISGEVCDKLIIDPQNFESRAHLPKNNDPDKYDVGVASKLDSDEFRSSSNYGVLGKPIQKVTRSCMQLSSPCGPITGKWGRRCDQRLI
jgi:hypothetical protein